MILKASQRSSGQNLAAHLLRTDDNEHVLVHDLRGFASDDLHGAFKEAEAVSRGTKCRQYLFSLSLNPPEAENVPVAVFEDAIERIEGKLKLEGQPRAIVFHEKEGKGLRGLWHRITGRYQQVRSENEREAYRTQERHAGERESLIERQRDERTLLQKQVREMRSQQAALLLELRKDIGRYLRMARARADSAALSRRRGSGLRLQR